MKVISPPQTERHLNSPVAPMCRPRMGTDLQGREGARRTPKDANAGSWPPELSQGPVSDGRDAAVDKTSSRSVFNKTFRSLIIIAQLFKKLSNISTGYC